MSKVSAFNVFHTKNRSKKELDDIGNSVGAKISDAVKENNEKASSSTSTPSALDKMPTKITKSEPRFNSLRKSLRKRTKKDEHHEENAAQIGKENKIQKVCEKIEKPDNLTLEEQFLPEVIKQRKEQEELHNAALGSYTSDSNTKSFKSPDMKCPRIGMYSNSSLHGKQLRRQVSGGKRLKRTHSLTDRLVDRDEERMTLADKLFEWLIAPVTSERFFSDVWQKKPCYIKRNQRKYNHIWFSTKEFDRILRMQNVQYTKNLDVAVYRNGQRETLNPEGRAFAPAVWKFYEEGCSIRLLNPQTFSKNVWRLSSKLQEYFGCMIGCNVYLTPPGSQGFAPHWDDIEAFVIQLEGKKQWKLYPSRNANEVLPRYSSKNLTQGELDEPILDRILEPGDTLYFPRGTIHQAFTLKDTHSLHITLSCYQKYSWSDYMEKLIPMALQTAIEEDVEFRKGLPIGCHTQVGVSNSNKLTMERKSFIKTAQELTKKLVSYVSVDIAAEELILDQMDEFLPPCLTSDENNCTIFGNGAYWESGSILGKSQLSLDTDVKTTRPGIARIITDEDGTHVHYTVENSREYKEIPLKRVEIPVEMAPAAQFLLFSHAKYVKVKDVPLETSEAKISLSQQFYDMGLLRTKYPLT